MATYQDNSTKDLTTDIEWVMTPANAVNIHQHTLTGKKDGNVTLQAKVGNTLSNVLKLNITWVVNGHVLPPEPDPAVNDSTLLGVDVNDNGVRDDVERWIYDNYEHPIERGIFMQNSRAYNSLLTTEPVKHQENENMNNIISCQFFLEDNNNYISQKYEYKYFSTDLKVIQFNTVKRIIAKRKYELSLSGGVYSLPSASKERCEFDESGILKAIK
jgi:hypothetical protein